MLLFFLISIILPVYVRSKTDMANNILSIAARWVIKRFGHESQLGFVTFSRKIALLPPMASLHFGFQKPKWSACTCKPTCALHMHLTTACNPSPIQLHPCPVQTLERFAFFVSYQVTIWARMLLAHSNRHRIALIGMHGHSNKEDNRFAELN